MTKPCRSPVGVAWEYAGLAAAYAASGNAERATELTAQVAEEIWGAAVLPQSVTFECSVAQLWLSLAVAEARLDRIDIAAAHVRRAYDAGWLDLTRLRPPRNRSRSQATTRFCLL